MNRFAGFVLTLWASSAIAQGGVQAPPTIIVAKPEAVTPTRRAAAQRLADLLFVDGAYAEVVATVVRNDAQRTALEVVYAPIHAVLQAKGVDPGPHAEFSMTFRRGAVLIDPTIGKQTIAAMQAVEQFLEAVPRDYPDGIKQRKAAILADIYSQAELDAMIKFFASPAGRLFVIDRNYIFEDSQLSSSVRQDAKKLTDQQDVLKRRLDEALAGFPKVTAIPALTEPQLAALAAALGVSADRLATPAESK